MNKIVDYNLYLVTDRDVLKGRELTEAIEKAIQGGATLVQLREKCVSSLEFYEIALSVKKITDKYKVPLIINDRLDVALAVDAEGLHVGQSDFSCTLARRLLGKNKIIGVSTSTLEEAKKAEKDGADYIGVGAVFPTDTKLDAHAVSINSLKEIKGKVNIPVVAIGGINENNYEKLKDANIDGLAIISAILGKEDIKQAAEVFKNWKK
jgi:thiamine-phosphate pyrophosphorylase